MFLRYILALLIFIPLSVNASTLSAAKIGGTYYGFSPTGLAWNALTAFRGVATPLSAALTLGQLIGAFRATDPSATMPTIFAPRNANHPAPSGWPSAETPPGTAPLERRYTCGSTTNLSQSQFVSCACSNLGGTFNVINWVNGQGVIGYNCTFSNGTNSNYQSGMPTSTTCPTGYSLSGGTCNLIPAQASTIPWPNDGIPTYRPDTNGNWERHPRDADPAPALQPSGNTFTRNGADTHGNPTRETLQSNPNGSVDMTRDTQSIDATGNPTVQRDFVSLNSSGNVTQVSTTTYNNTTINNVNNVTSTSSTVNIDTSQLAKDATLQEIKAKLEKDTSPFPTIPQSKTFAETLTDFKNKVKGSDTLLGKISDKTITDDSGECPVYNLELAYFARTYTFDQHCLILPNVQAIMSLIMHVCWVLLGAWIIFSA